MSFSPTPDPTPGDALSCDAIEMVIVPRTHDLGGFTVRRALPFAKRRMVGPFVFFDQMGPAVFKGGQGIDVRPHPHIGLSTVTYLFDGEIQHRDSLGTYLPVRPGEVNLMTAGRGIVHSERTDPTQKATGGHKLHGIQSWLALPKTHEEVAPGFDHIAADDLPIVKGDGKTIRVVIGEMYGVKAPTPVPWDTFYADAILEPGAKLPLDPVAEERAIYVAMGEIDVQGDHFREGQMLVLKPGDRLTLTAVTAARLILCGGATMDGPRHIWWNFVSSSLERIEQAKADWKQKRFDTVPGDEEEFIPLPE
ncbi:pirin family protein [Phreatobacter aquaticus]|uniref:Pirin family protein n=1 Tax=Phreatobacter aquaticus TaxID=2570229 RepID=A0A4D7QEH8_9HYPH|nr:pirin family protein [Phreatobacter aquaticus]QCK86390.1 pirin family protein [Phreatobacter aquaticus]